MRNVDHFEAMLEPIGTALLDAAQRSRQTSESSIWGAAAYDEPRDRGASTAGAVLRLDISPDLIVAAR